MLPTKPFGLVLYCTINFTKFNVEVWQKFQKLSPPKAGDLSSVQSVQVPKSWVKNEWPVNKRTGKKSVTEGTHTVLLPGARSQSTPSKLDFHKRVSPGVTEA